MPSVTFSAALAAGILSFLSPCILPLVPVYVANIAGASALTPNPPSVITRIKARFDMGAYTYGTAILRNTETTR